MKILLPVIFLFVSAFPVLAANSEMNFGGVGIDGVPLPNGQILVRQIVSGGPAHNIDIRIGDIITHIDGKATLGSDFRTIVQKRLRGIAGSKVVLKVMRKNEEKPLMFTLVRRQLVVKPFKEK